MAQPVGVGHDDLRVGGAAQALHDRVGDRRLAHAGERADLPGGLEVLRAGAGDRRVDGEAQRLGGLGDLPLLAGLGHVGQRHDLPAQVDGERDVPCPAVHPLADPVHRLAVRLEPDVGGHEHHRRVEGDAVAAGPVGGLEGHPRGGAGVGGAVGRLDQEGHLGVEVGVLAGDGAAALGDLLGRDDRDGRQGPAAPAVGLQVDVRGDRGGRDDEGLNDGEPVDDGAGRVDHEGPHHHAGDGGGVAEGEEVAGGDGRGPHGAAERGVGQPAGQRPAAGPGALHGGRRPDRGEADRPAGRDRLVGRVGVEGEAGPVAGGLHDASAVERGDRTEERLTGVAGDRAGHVAGRPDRAEGGWARHDGPVADEEALPGDAGRAEALRVCGQADLRRGLAEDPVGRDRGELQALHDLHDGHVAVRRAGVGLVGAGLPLRGPTVQGEGHVLPVQQGVQVERDGWGDVEGEP